MMTHHDLGGVGWGGDTWTMACWAATVTNRDKKSSMVRRLLTQTGGWMDGC